MSPIGNKIRELRTRKGYSQEKLAEISNVNIRTIQRVEDNKNDPSGTTLTLICSALDTTPEAILNSENDKNKSHLIKQRTAINIESIGLCILVILYFLTVKTSLSSLYFTFLGLLSALYYFPISLIIKKDVFNVLDAISNLLLSWIISMVAVLLFIDKSTPIGVVFLILTVGNLLFMFYYLHTKNDITYNWDVHCQYAIFIVGVGLVDVPFYIHRLLYGRGSKYSTLQPK